MMFTHCGYKNTAAMGKRNEDIYAEGRNAGLQIKLCFRKLPYHELKLYITFFNALCSSGGDFSWGDQGQAPRMQQKRQVKTSFTSRRHAAENRIGYRLESCVTCTFIEVGCSVHCFLKSRTSFSCFTHLLLFLSLPSSGP